MADSKITGFLSKDTAGLPNWAWLLVVGAGIAAVYVIPKFTGNKASSTNASSSTDTSGLGLAVDPTTGLPYAVEGLVPSGGTAGGISVSGTNAPPTSGGLPPPTFIGPPQTSGITGTVRASGQFPTWDAQHTGVPIRSAPGGNIIGYAPWGSLLQILNSSTGPSNQSGDPTAAGQGSTTWYQTAQGWVSAADISISSLLPLRASVVTTRPAWPGGTTQPRAV